MVEGAVNDFLILRLVKSIRVGIFFFFCFCSMVSFAGSKLYSECFKNSKILFEPHRFSNEFSQGVVKEYKNLVDWRALQKNNLVLYNSVSILLDHMARVGVMMNKGVFYCHFDRTAEFYLFGENKAILNQGWFDLGNFSAQTPAMFELQRARILLGFHILIGAAGYYDENYEKTLGLLALTHLFPNEKKGLKTSLDKEQNIDLLKVVNDIFLNQKPSALFTQLAGGSSGVSGGGDLLSLWMKVALIERDTLSRIIDKKCKSERSFYLICLEWPTRYDYLKFLFTFNLESSSLLTQVEYVYSPKGVIGINMPKISLEVLSALDLENKIKIVDLMVFHIANSANEKQRSK